MTRKLQDGQSFDSVGEDPLDQVMDAIPRSLQNRVLEAWSPKTETPSEKPKLPLWKSFVWMLAMLVAIAWALPVIIAGTALMIIPPLGLGVITIGAAPVIILIHWRCKVTASDSDVDLIEVGFEQLA